MDNYRIVSLRVKNGLGLFVVVGCILLIIAGYMFYSNIHFQRVALLAEGVVTEVRYERVGHSKGTYYPVIAFNTEQNKRVVFESSTGSSSYRGTEGKSMDVIYSANAPENAKINDMVSQWVAPIILASIGFAMTVAGFIAFLIMRVRSRRGVRLLQEGVPIEAEIIGVELNQAIQFNGRSPYRIKSQWLDKNTNQVFVFYSDNINFDPSSYIQGETITVYLDKNDPKKYHMDISLLPKIA